MSNPQGTVIAEVPISGTSALTTQEQDELEQHEATIEQGLQSFLTVGEALMGINARRLYRAKYSSFQDYCRDRWGIGRERAYQLMGAAEVVANLSTNLSTIVDSAPANEAQARPLTALPPDQQAAAWKEAVAAAPDGKPTAKHVQQAVEARRPAPAGGGGGGTSHASAASAKPAVPATLPPALPVPPTAPATLPPALPGLAAAPAPTPLLASPTPMLQIAVLAALLSQASAQATRAWEQCQREFIDRGQFPDLVISGDQLALAAQQLIDSPAVKMAAQFLGMGAQLRLELLDDSPIAVGEEVIA